METLFFYTITIHILHKCLMEDIAYVKKSYIECIDSMYTRPWQIDHMYNQPHRCSNFTVITLTLNFQHKCVWIFIDCLCIKTSGGGQNSERRNVERPIFRNFKITNIKITKDDLLDSFIFEYIFSLFINYLHNLIIFQIVKYWFSKW